MRELPVQEPGEPDHRSAARYLWWVARSQLRGMLAAALLGIVWMVAQALMPAVIGHAIDAGVSARDGAALALWTGLLFGLGVIQAAAGVRRHRNSVLNWAGGAFLTAQVTVRKAVELGAALPKRLAAGEVVSIGVSDVVQIGSAMDICGRGSGAVIAIAVVAVIMLTTYATAGLVTVAAVPVMAGAMALLVRPLHHRQQAQRERQAQLATRASDIVAGLRVLRGIGGEDLFAARYTTGSQAVMRAGIKVGAIESLLAGAEILLPGLLVALVVWIGATMALNGTIRPGQLVACYGYAVFLTGPIGTLTELADKITRGLVAARRVTALLDLAPDIASVGIAALPAGAAYAADGVAQGGAGAAYAADGGAGAGGVAHGSAGAGGVAQGGAGAGGAAGGAGGPGGDGAAGAGAWANRGAAAPELVDAESGLVVRPGLITAIAAAAAPDAVAIADRLGRFTDGDVSYGGVMLADLPKATVRRTILVCENSDRLLAGRLRDELDPYGAGEAKLTGALRAAAATEIVDALPDGLDARIADSGREFSGGQQQRLKLARALTADPPVLVLVEPTSAVDAHTEAAVAARLGAARAGRTTVIAATSPLVLARADHVVFVEGGKVVAEGRHADLLASHPGYAATVLREEA
ncbi:MAG TPA: ABC transporter ATP-binding protein [Streptosporangiaceae bacterium]|nr:ABC transporter ATP-binding protein [Streptosporangiaceae bacterium]